VTNPVRDNIVLVGMPGAGKSTIGILLAKALAMDFVDTDVLIQQRAGCTLRDYQQAQGIESFLKMEAGLLENLAVTQTVIATGGSAVYSPQAMDALRKHARVVFIDVPLAVLKTRLGDMAHRGVVQQPGQDLEALYQERWPLYDAVADITVNAADHAQELVLALILDALQEETE
jgi:shikimate kinase